MEIIHRFVIKKIFSSIEEIVRNTSQKVKIDEIQNYLSIEVSENDSCFYKLSTIMKKNSAVETVEARFNQKEIKEAEWLYVRSKWRCAYPQPREGFKYLSVTYDVQNTAPSSNDHLVCRCDLHQTGPFILEKTPAWKDKCFAMLNWVYDELFVCDRARRILERSELRGLGFYDVLNQRGDRLCDISQIAIRDKLNYGLSDSCFEKTFICDKCGMKKHLLKPGVIIYKRKCFDKIETDIIKTSELFGEITGTRYVLISH